MNTDKPPKPLIHIGAEDYIEAQLAVFVFVNKLKMTHGYRARVHQNQLTAKQKEKRLRNKESRKARKAQRK